MGYYFLVEYLIFSVIMYKFLFFRYPSYEFISDNSISWSAGLHNRYTENSLRGVILDIHFLSQADFLVCTFSSQVSDNRVFLSGNTFWLYWGQEFLGFLHLFLMLVIMTQVQFS